MKKVASKLSLNKETVTKLNDAQMGIIKGGEIAADAWSRRSKCPKRPCRFTAVYDDMA
jgi:hypothetical protein